MNYILGAVGKSALVQRFLAAEDALDEKYDPTISANYTKDVVIDDEPVTIEILGTLQIPLTLC